MQKHHFLEFNDDVLCIVAIATASVSELAIKRPHPKVGASPD